MEPSGGAVCLFEAGAWLIPLSLFETQKNGRLGDGRGLRRGSAVIPISQSKPARLFSITDRRDSRLLTACPGKHCWTYKVRVASDS
jgi:hypothetical protein